MPHIPKKSKPSLKEKIINKLLKRIKRVKGGCWVWVGKKVGGVFEDGKRVTEGYPTFTISLKRYSARRESYIHLGGHSDPGDKQLRTTCGKPECINPAHIFLDGRKIGGRPRETSKKHKRK